jgi:hypothetical protein
MQEEQFLSPTSPRPFSEIPGLWLKITQMTEEFFAQEAPRASVSNVLIGVLIFAVASTILSMISSAIMGGAQMAFLPPEARETVAATLGGNVVCTLCCGFIGTIAGFYISNGLAYLGARVLGGSGDFGTQTYLQSLFAVPLGIAAAAVNLVPCVGIIAALALAVYGFILNVRAIKVVHDLTTGKAVAAVLVPALLLGLLVACGVIVLLAILGPVVYEVFQNIVDTMPQGLP